MPGGETSISVNSNVKVTTIDKKGKVLRVSQVHNKATILLVEGILRFLQGDFNPTYYNNNVNKIRIFEAQNYLPVEFRFGNVGVNLNRDNVSYPTLLGVTNSKMKTPTFDDYRLQEEIPFTQVILGRDPTVDTVSTSRLDNKSARLGFETVTQTAFDDSNNSLGLLIRTFIPSGRLVGYGKGVERVYFTPEGLEKCGSYGSSLPRESRGWVYWDNKNKVYETMITEMGLVTQSGGLLARVLFDGVVSDIDDGCPIFEYDDADNNPIIQADNTSLVIEWKIGLVSIGDNDKILTGADLRNLGTDITE